MRISTLILLLLCFSCFGQVAFAGSGPNVFQPAQRETVRPDLDKTIRLEIVVNASAEKVWRAWTTREGIRSFFAPDCEIDLRVLGKYDILFAPSAPVGLRGAEGNLLLAIQREKMLSFTW